LLGTRSAATGTPTIAIPTVGKLAVPDSILKKPDKLTSEEFQVVKRHSETGYRTLKELGFRESVRRLVLDHHERLDGTGYPRGLSGPAISLDARILAVCDVYDALISTRVYREAWNHERAIGLLHHEAGTKLDRRCVAALERVRARERAPEAVAV
jgi:HD-GYP domain-containing protein (c-di-GMP phosphodiesterase class II)